MELILSGAAENSGSKGCASASLAGIGELVEQAAQLPDDLVTLENPLPGETTALQQSTVLHRAFQRHQTGRSTSRNRHGKRGFRSAQ